MASPAAKQQLVASYGRLPLSFEANHGQTDASVKFLSRGNGYTLFLTANEAVLTLRRSQESEVRSQNPSHDPAKRGSGGLNPSHAPRDSGIGTRDPENPKRDINVVSPEPRIANSESRDTVLRMKLVGANPNPEVVGDDELPGKSNYFLGNDPSKWRTNVPTYAKVRYQDVYPGIDLVYYGNQRQLEYDLVVAPGADPRAIRFAFQSRDRKQAVNPNGYPSTTLRAGRERADHQSPDREGGGIHQNRESLEAVPLRIDSQGDLVLDTADGSNLRLHQPVIYQEISGARQRIGGNFVIHGKPKQVQGTQEVGFEVARYDASKPLIIDPVLSYSTYLGGSGEDYGLGIAVDSSGNAYVTGSTISTNFPTANAFQAAYGDGTSSPFGGDAFVTRLNAAGSALVYSTYLGGSSYERGSGIAVDSSGNAYVTGRTGSTNFPTANAFQAAFGGGSFPGDAFVTKLNAAGSALVYSTYLGGSNNDSGNGIAVDSSGNAYVTGGTGSGNFPTANPFQAAHGGGPSDAFVTKLNAAGSALVYSTYLGGGDEVFGDAGYGIAVDSSGNVYVTGLTGSSNFPTANPFQPALGAGICGETLYTFPCADGFVTKLNAAGSALAYSTYLGGSGSDSGSGIAVDSSGNAYVTGYTSSTDFPTANAFQAAFGGGFRDAFVAKLNATGSALVYSTYLGGSGWDQGAGIAVDSSGNAYVTGYTNSTDFPTANAFQAALGGFGDVLVTKFNAAGSALVYSTYLGGGNSNDEGYGIAVDSSGNAYVTGRTCSTNFPTANAFQAANGGPTFCDDDGGDAFVTKFPAVTEGVLSPPQLPQGAVVNGASFAAGAPVAPGSIASVFGLNFASTLTVASSLPLFTSLGGASVKINGVAAPLIAVSPQQINFQIPWEAQGQTPASLTVTSGEVTSNPTTVGLTSFRPGLFAINQQGTGQGAILIAPTAIIAAPVGTVAGSRPVNRGVESISIFCTGLGPVTNPPPSGAAAPVSPTSSTTTLPTVTIGNVQVTASFSGLASGFVGLYQVNALVPANAPTGNAVPVVLTIGGVTSNTVTIAVQ